MAMGPPKSRARRLPEALAISHYNHGGQWYHTQRDAEFQPNGQRHTYADTHTYPKRDTHTYPESHSNSIAQHFDPAVYKDRRKCCDRRVHHRGQ